MARRHLMLLAVGVAVGVTKTGGAGAQGLPTTQPSLLTIVREDVKPGRSAEHRRIEAGWPAAFAKSKSADYYLAMESMTGPGEAWFITPYQSHAKWAESMSRDEGNATISAELDRLARVDSDVLNNVRVMHASARADLSSGNFPNLALQRFWEISWWRVRPGHEGEFEAAAKAYGSSAKRAGSLGNYRVYEIIAGVPGPTYLIFSSVPNFADFDKTAADGQKVMAGVNAEEGAALQKFALNGLINNETQRFRLSPAMSYVAAETKAQDPSFWSPKKMAPKP